MRMAETTTTVSKPAMKIAKRMGPTALVGCRTVSRTKAPSAAMAPRTIQRPS
jgi:hypothetical protein